MPLQCFATGKALRQRVRRQQGFTLLELIVVVALMGLMAGMVGVRMGNTSTIARERSTLESIVSAIAMTRVQCMRTSQPQCVVVELTEDTFAVSAPGVRQVIAAHGLRLIDEHMETLGTVEACFDASGRTPERVWRFISRDVKRNELLNTDILRTPWEHSDEVHHDVQGQVWRIVFDPVSGAPRVERVDGQ